MMLRLDLKALPSWHDLIPGLRVHLAPLTTVLMVAARSQPIVKELPDGASAEEAALAMAKALARTAILDWEGVGDAEGAPLAVSPEAIDALLDIWPIFEAFQTVYVAKGLLLDAEKNVSSPLPSGRSAGAMVTARPADPSALTAPQE